MAAVIALGFVAAFVSAAARGRAFVRFISRHGFARFCLVPHCSGRIGARPIAHALKLLPLAACACHKPRNQAASRAVLQHELGVCFMQRRKFIRTAGVGAAAVATTGTLAAPAIAQSAPELKWRMTSSFPKSLDTIFGGAEHLRQVRRRGDRQQVPDPRLRRRRDRSRPAGRSTPCRTAPSRWATPPPTTTSARTRPSRFDCAVPFGLNTRQQNAWVNQGGGARADERVLQGLQHPLACPCGNTGAQMGGWFRKEIKTVDDLKGLKMRISGFAGEVMTKLGVVPQQIAGGDIYPALEKGTIDAAEWVGPYDDQKLGFNKVAPYYYYPGWWEGGAAALGLCEPRRSGTSCRSPTRRSSKRPAAKAHNCDAVEVRRRRTRRRCASWSPPAPSCCRSRTPILEACFNATNEVYAETHGEEPQVQEDLRDRGSRSAPRRCCGSASPRTRSTTSWRASRRPTSSRLHRLEMTRKTPLRRGFSLPAAFGNCFSIGVALCDKPAPPRSVRMAESRVQKQKI